MIAVESEGSWREHGHFYILKSQVDFQADFNVYFYNFFRVGVDKDVSW